MEGGGAAMAEDRLGAARQYGGQPAAAQRDARLADGVNAAMNGMEQTPGEPALYMTLRYAPADQLPPGHHTVLTTSQH